MAVANGQDLDRPAFVQPGQGTQRIGMGRWLFQRSRRARQVLETVSAVTGMDLQAVMASGPSALLADTRYAQPAIFAVNLAAESVLVDHGVHPVAVAGHSSGELSALVTAGAVDIETGARLVAARASLMASVSAEGAMGAVMGLDVAQVEGLCDELVPSGVIVVAAENAPRQIVVSGESSLVARCLERAKKAGALRAVQLRTSNAFHSPMMSRCRDGWAEAVSAVDLRRPRVPLILNRDGAVHTEPDVIREALIEQMTGPVRWTRVVRTLATLGPSAVVECGDSRVLTATVRSVDRTLPVVSMESERNLRRVRVSA